MGSENEKPKGFRKSQKVVTIPAGADLSGLTQTEPPL
jgi:hypothetical protein